MRPVVAPFPTLMRPGISVAETLRHARRASGLSVRELADRVGISKSAIARWECGESLPPPAHWTVLQSQLSLPDWPSLLAAPSDWADPSTGPTSARSGVIEGCEVALPDALRSSLLRAFRLRTGRSARQVGEQADVAASTIVAWESGRHRPTARAIHDWAAALNLTEPERSAGISGVVPLPSDWQDPRVALQMLARARSQGWAEWDRDADRLLIGLIARCHESPRLAELRIEATVLYAEWLNGWYRDGEAAQWARHAAQSARLLPEPYRLPIWGRITRYLAIEADELRGDLAAAHRLRQAAARDLRGFPSQGFVVREAVLGEMSVRPGDVVERANRIASAPNLEDPADNREYCLAAARAELWLRAGRPDRAARILEPIGRHRPAVAFLNLGFEMLQARVRIATGDGRGAQSLLRDAIGQMNSLGYPHFARTLAKHLAVCEAEGHG
ncbi:MAG: helix-turn-helix transcriptional regulator [Fimbriimonadaceae bacterium]|nr:helix-turn-helix transcriptional regulator [Fimbriimonadaceae bacterium]